MNPIIKWIGGATAVLVLAVGGATLASDLMASDAAISAPNSPSADKAISVDAAMMTPSEAAADGQTQFVSSEVVQAVPESKPEPKDETFVIKRILPIDGPIKYGEWHWDEEGVPAGPLVVTVDLDARVMSVFRGGYEIGATAVMLGTDDHPTPLGTFPILTKERHNVSEKYNNAPMPWTLRLTWDGIAIHGGNEVENGFASHGCIGTPNDFVSKLYDIAKKGDKVIITRGKQIGMGDSII